MTAPMPPSDSGDSDTIRVGARAALQALADRAVRAGAPQAPLYAAAAAGQIALIVVERPEAAWPAARMLRDRGLEWDSLIPRTLAPPEAPNQHQPRQSASLYPWSSKLAFILDRPHYLTAWELHFATDVQYRRKITPKQSAVLTRIYDRLASQSAG